ncbi:MAG: hypothetical protein QOI76_981 [Frankiales bacterium]|nr:hypothetical protein [Frankiales bacterium]
MPAVPSGSCATCERQKPTPFEFAPPGAVIQPGGTAAAAEADTPSIAATPADVAMTRQDPFRLFMVVSLRTRDSAKPLLTIAPPPLQLADSAFAPTSAALPAKVTAATVGSRALDWLKGTHSVPTEKDDSVGAEKAAHRRQRGAATDRKPTSVDGSGPARGGRGLRPRRPRTAGGQPRPRQLLSEYSGACARSTRKSLSVSNHLQPARNLSGPARSGKFDSPAGWSS